MAKLGYELIANLRVDLDSFDPQTSLWDDSALLMFLNRAANKVASVLRQEAEGYLEKTLTTSDSAQSIYGATYTPSTALALAVGATTVTLPENLVSLKSIQSTSQTQLDNGLSFHITKSDSEDYKLARRVTAPTVNQSYFCVFEGLTTLRIAPALQQAVNLSITYAAMPERVTATAAVEGIPEYAENALLVYAQYLALWSIKHEDVAVAYQMWQTERKELLEMISTRDATEIEVVMGAFESFDDDYMYDL